MTVSGLFNEAIFTSLEIKRPFQIKMASINYC